MASPGNQHCANSIGALSFPIPRGAVSKWQWHQLGHMQVCTLLQTDNHASTPPLRPDALPAAQPTASKHWRQIIIIIHWYNAILLHDSLWMRRRRSKTKSNNKRLSHTPTSVHTSFRSEVNTGQKTDLAAAATESAEQCVVTWRLRLAVAAAWSQAVVCDSSVSDSTRRCNLSTSARDSTSCCCRCWVSIVTRSTVTDRQTDKLTYQLTYSLKVS